MYHSFEGGLIVQHKTINWVRHPTRALPYIRLVSRGYFGKRICTPPYTPLHTTPHTHSALASSCYSLAWHWCCRTSPSWGSRCDPHDPGSLGSNTACAHKQQNHRRPTEASKVNRNTSWWQRESNDHTIHYSSQAGMPDKPRL